MFLGYFCDGLNCGGPHLKRIWLADLLIWTKVRVPVVLQKECASPSDALEIWTHFVRLKPNLLTQRNKTYIYGQNQRSRSDMTWKEVETDWISYCVSDKCLCEMRYHLDFTVFRFFVQSEQSLEAFQEKNRVFKLKIKAEYLQYILLHLEQVTNLRVCVKAFLRKNDHFLERWSQFFTQFGRKKGAYKG